MIDFACDCEEWEGSMQTVIEIKRGFSFLCPKCQQWILPLDLELRQEISEVRGFTVREVGRKSFALIGDSASAEAKDG